MMHARERVARAAPALRVKLAALGFKLDLGFPAGCAAGAPLLFSDMVWSKRNESWQTEREREKKEGVCVSGETLR